MFAVSKIPFGNTYLIQLLNEVTGEYVSIFPEMGARTNQICLSCNKALHPLLWEVNDEDELLKEGLPQYRGAFLFPFVDRLEKGKYTFDNVEYTLPCNEANHKNALHGFLNDKEFQVLDLKNSKEEAAVHLFYEYNGALEGYSFSCEISIQYILNEKGFNCNTKVQNKTGQSMPVGIGWHPYFRLLDNPSQFEVRVPAKTSFITRQDYINTGEQVAYNKCDTFIEIDNFTFNAFAIDQTKKLAKTILRDKKNKTEISIESEGFPYLQLYRVADKAIAIEPLTCIGNAFNNGIGLTVLLPNEIMKNSFSVKLFPVDYKENRKALRTY